MKIKSITFLLSYLLLFILIVPAIAWECEGDPPGDCYECEDGSWVEYGDCWGGCPYCEECISCWCTCTSQCCEDSDCTGECHNGCGADCKCIDSDLNCSSIDCETCNEGVCEDECLPLEKHCYYGSCVECRDLLDCDLCEKCLGFECEHNCEYCVWPKYCAYACFCVECNTEGTSTCSESLDTECLACYRLTHPCSEVSVRVYTGNSVYTSCEGADCEPVEVLCYRTYPCTTGVTLPLFLCYSGDQGLACHLNGTFPSVCTLCKRQPYGGIPSYQSGYDECPTLDWP